MTAPRTIVITGASDGIGAVAARALAGPDVNLVVVGRSAQKLAPVAADTGATPLTADFARLDEVRSLAQQIREQVGTIDILMNNAGGIFAPHPPTADGHEPNFQINHLAPFLLTNLLHDRLAAAKGALVLNTSSIGNRFGHIDLDDLDYRRRRALQARAYGSSKLMNILFTRGIAKRWADDGIISAAVHPGPVASSFGRDSFFVGLLYRTPLRHFAAITPAQGAAPLVELARRGADPEINGVYFDRHRARGRENRQAHDPKLIDGLWAISAELVGVG
ncbi:SDR family NAD(P)-dependent oxidoreductase [Mycolicibacter longobardus]|uniref:Short-chain dehydrogenase n=1 Tax=Mycolicibacter longobardus TaxID=1108812 RepID=A0A1X1YL69_9MYCO|nr:SDR family NAD(P)-dependent oxidoreductase [Mycolicibacter longobardus]MCV7385044.1 SDR family NAD(P)-dependent oxidoreductase [Mycolicibacter longobardus]ORW11848.1 short-chain dehydrogenase [Mycolicibacter longobardus]